MSESLCCFNTRPGTVPVTRNCGSPVSDTCLTRVTAVTSIERSYDSEATIVQASAPSSTTSKPCRS